jgi:hypothetical protein
MKNFDIFLNIPQLKDPEEQREMAAFCAKLQEILQYISNNLGAIKVLTSAPAAGELDVRGDGQGNVLSEVAILDNAIAGSRKIYYKEVGGNLRTITSA